MCILRWGYTGDRVSGVLADSLLWSMDNVIVTPHIAGLSTHYNDRIVDLMSENLRRYLAGEPLLNLVQRELGY